MTALTWSSLRPRERRVALVAGAFIGTGILVSWVVQPLWDRAQAVRQHVTAQTKKLEAVSRLLEQAPVIDRSHHQLAPFLAGSAEGAGQGALLNELEALARRAHLYLNLKPRPVAGDERMNRFEVEVDVEGSQESVLGFLDQLLASPKLMRIERLRLSSVPAKEHLVRGNLLLQYLFPQ